jgi:hypothetical protein
MLISVGAMFVRRKFQQLDLMSLSGLLFESEIVQIWDTWIREPLARLLIPD